VLAVRGLNNFFWAFYIIAAPVLVDRRYRTSVGGWGLIIVAYSLGQLVSNIVAGNRRGGGQPIRALVLGWVVQGLGFIGLGLAPRLELGLLAIFVSGLGGPIAHVTTDTYVAATTAPDRLARVFALQRTAMDIVTAAGMAICGAILALIPHKRRCCWPARGSLRSPLRQQRPLVRGNVQVLSPSSKLAAALEVLCSTRTPAPIPRTQAGSRNARFGPGRRGPRPAPRSRRPGRGGDLVAVTEQADHRLLGDLAGAQPTRTPRAARRGWAARVARRPGTRSIGVWPVSECSRWC
jgi:MFS family permease